MNGSPLEDIYKLSLRRKMKKQAIIRSPVYIFIQDYIHVHISNTSTGLVPSATSVSFIFNTGVLA